MTLSLAKRDFRSRSCFSKWDDTWYAGDFTQRQHRIWLEASVYWWIKFLLIFILYYSIYRIFLSSNFLYDIGSEGSLGIVTKVAILTPPKLSSVNLAFLACKDYKSCLVSLRKLTPVMSKCWQWCPSRIVHLSLHLIQSCSYLNTSLQLQFDGYHLWPHLLYDCVISST